MTADVAGAQPATSPTNPVNTSTRPPPQYPPKCRKWCCRGSTPRVAASNFRRVLRARH